MSSVVLLHGRGSSAALSRKVRVLREYLRDNAPDIHVFAPTWDSEIPFPETFAFFLDYMKHVPVADGVAFIGNSLGGFWARLLARRHPGSRLVMFNPGLLSYYGRAMEMEDRPGTPILLYLCRDDLVVPYRHAHDLFQGRATIRLLTTGGHDIAQFPELLPEILAFLRGEVVAP